MAAKVYAKYLLEPEGRDVHGRFTALYNSASKGKGLLLSQCVAGGTLLKECGLLELAASICESEAYITATTSSQRRAILLGELGALVGAIKTEPAAPPAIHSTHRESAAPIATPEATGEQPEASDAAEPSATGQEEQPVPHNKRPQVRKMGVELPNIGASTNQKK
jgi:hypothetical protein